MCINHVDESLAGTRQHLISSSIIVVIAIVVIIILVAVMAWKEGCRDWVCGVEDSGTRKH